MVAPFPIALDRDAGRSRPLSRQLSDEIRRRVQAGTAGPGDRLPTVRAFAQSLGVTPETVASAYKQLSEEGYLRAQVGRGTFVAAPPLRAEEDPLAPFQAAGALPPFGAASVAPGPPADRDLLRLASRPGIVSFAGSVAAFDLAPIGPLGAAIAAVLAEEGSAALQVGPTEGHFPLRQAIASLLQERGIDTTAANVCITSGCQQGIDLAAKIFVGQGDAVLVEQPGFLGALEAFRARGARVIGVPVEADGLRIDMVPSLIQRHRPKLLYCMPTYQNPTGRTLGPEKRLHLLRLAAAYDLPIVEDDSAGFYPLGADAAPSSLRALDHAGYVIHLGTFSKLIAAGLRLGWLVASSPVFEKLVAAKYASDLSSDALSQRAVARLLQDGVLQQHVMEARTHYARRRDVLVNALRAPGALPSGSHFDVPRGGFNLWLELPADGPPSTDLYLESVARGVAFVPGSFFYAAAGGSAAAARGLRLCYSAVQPERIGEGVRLISNAWRALRARSHAPTPSPAVVY